MRGTHDAHAIFVIHFVHRHGIIVNGSCLPEAAALECSGRHGHGLAVRNISEAGAVRAGNAAADRKGAVKQLAVTPRGGIEQIAGIPVI